MCTCKSILVYQTLQVFQVTESLGSPNQDNHIELHCDILRKHNRNKVCKHRGGKLITWHAKNYILQNKHTRCRHPIF